MPYKSGGREPAQKQAKRHPHHAKDGAHKTPQLGSTTTRARTQLPIDQHQQCKTQRRQVQARRVNQEAGAQTAPQRQSNESTSGTAAKPSVWRNPKRPPHHKTMPQAPQVGHTNQGQYTGPVIHSTPTTSWSRTVSGPHHPTRPTW